MQFLELLAPARTKDIGIAAIDCGADAVYIAGPEFGARKAAGNSFEDIAELCAYAHRFGARIFVTFNTLWQEGEAEEAHAQLIRAQRGLQFDELCRETGFGYADVARLAGQLEEERFIDIDLLQRCTINVKIG